MKKGKVKKPVIVLASEQGNPSEILSAAKCYIHGNQLMGANECEEIMKDARSGDRKHLLDVLHPYVIYK